MKSWGHVANARGSKLWEYHDVRGGGLCLRGLMLVRIVLDSGG